MKNKQAVALARDVLAQLRTRQLIARAQTYFGNDTDLGAEMVLLALDMAAGKRGASCEVCAVGALFMKRLEHGHAGAQRAALQVDLARQTLRRYERENIDYSMTSAASASKDYNRLSARDTWTTAAVSDAFSKAELDAIEDAFEARDGWGDRDPQPWATEWLIWQDDQERLAAIMLAIVRDGGTFSRKSKLPTNKAVTQALAPLRKARKARARVRS